MTNNKYQSGRRREYKVKKRMEKLGYICMRTAGSHGIADIIGANKQWRVIRFIQVKPKTMSDKARMKLEKEFDWLNGKDFEVKFEVTS